MSELYPLVDVVVLLIGRDGRLLLDYNEPWSAFCLPITKLRELPATVPNGEGGREAPMDAAVRAAVEVLGAPLSVDRFPKPVETDIPPYQQSSRDGQWKRYKFHLFSMKIAFDPRPLPGHTAVWLKPEELKTHQPISPTMTAILGALDKGTLAKLLA
jgi:hypothetical protein